jgi:bifunctional UDP-N-acetylglucosamine pyrophosphorylase/glucosamine-1-phosphate N-acetyltransferase
MQCVILAAGKGTRLKPLTDNCPKPLVKVGDKALLDYIVESLPSAVDEIIIVVGYLGEMIREYCGEEFHGKKVKYVEQKVQDGTGRALWLCKGMLKGRFLFMFADDIHGKNDIARVASYTRGILTKATDTPERFGVIVRNPDGTLAEIIEKPTHPPSNLVSTGVMVLDEHIFEFEPVTPINGEFYLTEAIEKYARVYPVAAVEEEMWLPIGYPEDIKKAEEILGGISKQ